MFFLYAQVVFVPFLFFYEERGYTISCILSMIKCSCRPMDLGTKNKSNPDELLITRLYYNVRIINLSTVARCFIATSSSSRAPVQQQELRCVGKLAIKSSTGRTPT
jgi:hypothetical protein